MKRRVTTMTSSNKITQETKEGDRESSGSLDVIVEDGTVKEGGCCAPESSPLYIFVKLSVCTAAGIVFGWVLEKSRVFEPASIRGQMVFTRWIMLKMFLAAVASGQLVLALLSLLPPTKDKFNEAVASFSGCFTGKGFISSALGPFILGAGMTLSGACPGMVLAQVGSWTKNAIFTFIGVLIGTLLYGLVAPWIVKFTQPKKPLKYASVHQKFKIPYAALAIPSSLFFGIVVFLLEWFIPWQDDLDPVNVNQRVTSNVFILKSWPPSVAGVAVGVLQFFVVLSVTDTLGGSSSYQTLVAQWVVTPKLQELFPYLAKYRCGLGNWWQVFYVSGAMIGGCLSALASDSLATTKGATIATALMGGIILSIGARFASGCTSGHGLSGMGLLMWFSILAVPFMFGGGIVTGFAMQAAGALDDYECNFGNCTTT